MSDENKNMQQIIEHEFVNSKDVGESMKRLILEPLKIEHNCCPWS